jgi:hypothetical protein
MLLSYAIEATLPPSQCTTKERARVEMIWEGMYLPGTVVAHCWLSVVEQATVIVDHVLSSYAGFRGGARHGNRWRSRSRRKQLESGPPIPSLLIAAPFQSNCRRELARPSAKE